MQYFYEGMDNNLQLEDLESQNGRARPVTDDVEKAYQYLNEGCI